MTTAAAYVRVSTEGQAENGLSLGIQRDQIAQHCAEQEWDLVQIYEDAGVSGALDPLERPAMRQLLSDCRAEPPDFVIVARYDRLARDTYCHLFVEKELLVHDTRVFSIAEPYQNDDPMTVAFREMAAVFAKLEKQLIVLRLKNGRLKKSANGGYLGGNSIPFGVAVEGSGADAVLVPGQYADAVLGAFEAYAGGASMDDVAEHIRQRGIPTLRGGYWCADSVLRMLANQRYVALGIVSQEIFDACAARREARSKHRRREEALVNGEAQTA